MLENSITLSQISILLVADFSSGFLSPSALFLNSPIAKDAVLSHKHVRNSHVPDQSLHSCDSWVFVFVFSVTGLFVGFIHSDVQ